MLEKGGTAEQGYMGIVLTFKRFVFSLGLCYDFYLFPGSNEFAMISIYFWVVMNTPLSWVVMNFPGLPVILKRRSLI
jgi:hypothetical protein